MVAHGGQLLRLGVGQVGCVVYGISRPYPDISIWKALTLRICNCSESLTSSSCDKSVSVGGDMATVDFEVLLLS